MNLTFNNELIDSLFSQLLQDLPPNDDLKRELEQHIDGIAVDLADLPENHSTLTDTDYTFVRTSSYAALYVLLTVYFANRENTLASVTLFNKLVDMYRVFNIEPPIPADAPTPPTALTPEQIKELLDKNKAAMEKYGIQDDNKS